MQRLGVVAVNAEGADAALLRQPERLLGGLGGVVYEGIRFRAGTNAETSTGLWRYDGTRVTSDAGKHVAMVRTLIESLVREGATLLTHDVATLTLDAPVDAVIGRLVLMYFAEPALVLCHLAGFVRPGGLVVPP